MSRIRGLALLCAVLVPAAVRAAEGTVPVGLGSYATRPPDGAKGPPTAIYKTEAVTGAMPTNDWWSSVAWMPFSERMYPHPLAVQAGAKGLRVYYPGTSITANQAAIFGFMPTGSDDDFVIGHSAQAAFPDARVDGFSDWFVRVRFAEGKNVLKVSFGHGSPFVYALYEGGTPRLSFAKPPAVWSGSERVAELGVTVNDRHYGLFGPSGSTWDGLGTKALTCRSGGKRHFSIAILPDRSEATLKLFRQYAHSHVTDTRVAWSYDPQASAVTTTFTLETTAIEGSAKGTLFALYPHQSRSATTPLLDLTYNSVRGKMKLGHGTSFATRTKFPGVLPSLPNVGGCDTARLASYLAAETRQPDPPTKDTYWEGKHLGKLATLIPIAEQFGVTDAEAELRKRLQGRLERWFTAQSAGPGLFCYNRTWGTLIGYPPSYGSDTELNDHHFHYGYFIKGAAEIARHDPAWGADGQWGGMVKLLIRDVASPDRADPMFPFLRCFDPYAGHSWASGHAKFGDGNNNESSSEAMNAWCGLVLWGEATGDRALRDLGIWLFTTEMTAINEYWFDVHGDNFPKSYPPSVVTMVWGGKGANGTWFSANPEAVHGINWLPIHGGSLYLGHYPAYVRKNYAALVQENKGTQWDQWADIIWMYLALADPAAALAQFEAAEGKYPAEAGNSKANTYHWLHTLSVLGGVDPAVTADYPLYAVFRKGTQRTYVAYNMSAQPRTVTFSDGHRLEAKGRAFAVGRKGAE